MRVQNANKLLGMTRDQIMTVYHNNPMVRVKFDDGEVEMRWRYVIYSWMFWEFHRNYSKLKLSKHHLVGNRPMDDDTDNELLNHLSKDLYFAYGERDYPKATVGKTIYTVINNLHELTKAPIEEYFTMLDNLDVLEIRNHPHVQKLLAEIQPTRISIEHFYAEFTDFIYNDESIAHNQLIISVRQGTNNVKQVLELTGIRGYITEINDVRFPHPVMSSHISGTVNPIDRLMDSRTGTKSLTSNVKPLQQSEYQGRRLRLLGMLIRGIKKGDCGSKHYVKHQVTKENLKHIDGVWVKQPDGSEKVVWASDKELIGQVIEMRNPLGCLCKNHVCERCYGLLHLSVPENTNIGWSCAMQFSEKISQGTLSLKHLAFNPVAKILRYMITDKGDVYHPLITGEDKPENFYLRDETIKDNSIGFAVKEVPFMADFEDIKTDGSVSVKEVAELTVVDFVNNKEVISEPLVETVGSNKAPTAMSLEFLRYIRKHGYVNNGNRIYVNLEHWNMDEPLFVQELRAESNLDMVNKLRWVLEGSNNIMSTKDISKNASVIEHGVPVIKTTNRSDALSTLYDAISYKIPLHTSVMGVMLKAVTAISPDENDYRVASADVQFTCATLDEKLRKGSAGGAFGYEKLKRYAEDTSNFDRDDVDPHLMDVYITGRYIEEDTTTAEEEVAARRAQAAY